MPGSNPTSGGILSDHLRWFIGGALTLLRKCKWTALHLFVLFPIVIPVCAFGADSYPDKPIRMILPGPRGGGEGVAA